MRFVQSVVGIVMYGMLVVVIVRAYLGIDIRDLSVRFELIEENRFCEKVEAFCHRRNSAAAKHQFDVELLVLVVGEVFHVLLSFVCDIKRRSVDLFIHIIKVREKENG